MKRGLDIRTATSVEVYAREIIRKLIDAGNAIADLLFSEDQH